LCGQFMHRRVLEIASRGHRGSKRFLLPVVVTKVAKLFIRRALVSRTSRGGPDVELLRRRTSLSLGRISSQASVSLAHSNGLLSIFARVLSYTFQLFHLITHVQWSASRISLRVVSKRFFVQHEFTCCSPLPLLTPTLERMCTPADLALLQ